MRALLRYTVLAGVVALLAAGCATSQDTDDEPDSTQQFSQNKQKVVEQEQREAERRREREAAMRAQKEQVDSQLDEPAERPPRTTIPEAQLPEVGPCDEPGNVTACGMIDGPDGEVRVTASMAPAVMTKGAGQMQIGAVLRDMKKQVDTLLPCYGWAHLNEQAESTEFDVEVDVKVDGEVEAARVTPTSTPVGAAGCMEERIESWSMPVPSGGGATVIATVVFTST